MKRFFAIVFAIIMCIELSACGNVAQKAASQVTTTAETAAEQLTEETTEKEMTAESTEQIETTETTAQTVETQVEEFKITDGYFYEWSPHSGIFTEWKFNEDGTCSNKYMINDDSETYYGTYILNGKTVSIESDTDNSVANGWEISIENKCCYFYGSMFNPGGAPPTDIRLTILWFDHALSQDEIDSLTTSSTSAELITRID